MKMDPRSLGSVVSVCASIMFRAPFTCDAVALQRHAFLCTLPVTPENPGVSPKVIITDGWDAYVQAMARFSQRPTSLCRFTPCVPLAPAAGPCGQWSTRRLGRRNARAVFVRPQSGTVRRRLDTLQARPWSPTKPLWLGSWQTAAAAAGGRSTWRPYT